MVCSESPTPLQYSHISAAVTTATVTTTDATKYYTLYKTLVVLTYNGMLILRISTLFIHT